MATAHTRRSDAYSHDAYLSYPSAERPWARRLWRELSERDVRVFSDFSLHPGERWSDRMNDGLSAARALVVLWSKAAREAPGVLSEIGSFETLSRLGDEERRIIPVFLGAGAVESAPMGLRERQGIVIPDDMHMAGPDAADPRWHEIVEAIATSTRTPNASPSPPSSAKPEQLHPLLESCFTFSGSPSPAAWLIRPGQIATSTWAVHVNTPHDVELETMLPLQAPDGSLVSAVVAGWWPQHPRFQRGVALLRLAPDAVPFPLPPTGTPATGRPFEVVDPSAPGGVLMRGTIGELRSDGSFALGRLPGLARGGGEAELSGAPVWDPSAERLVGVVCGFDGDTALLEPIDTLLEIAAGVRQAVTAPPTARVHADRWTIEDDLNYALYARAITEFVLHPDTKPPLVISVQGPWGQGKTSLMRMLQERLDSDHPDLRAGGPAPDAPERPSAITFGQLRDFIDDGVQQPTVPPSGLRTVWFNAWKYQSSEEIWAGMAHAILQQLSARLTPVERELFWLRLQLRRIDPGAVRSEVQRAALERLVPHLAAGAVTLFAGLLCMLAGGALFTGLGLVSLPAAALYTVRQWSSAEQGALDRRLQGSYLRYLRQPDYTDKMGYLHLVEEDVRRALDLLTPDDAPTVIFIDDLDRCAPDKIGAVLEAINLFLSGDFPNCVFVLGIDTEVVAAAMEVVHRDVIQKLHHRRGELGWRFMDKFVQLPFVMPRLSSDQRQAYLRRLVATGSAAGEDRGGMAATTDALRASLDSEAIDGSEAIQRIASVEPEVIAADPEGWRALAEDAIVAGAREFTDYNPETARVLGEQMSYLSDNPRTIKRAVNLYRFHRFTAWARQASPLGLSSADPGLIARWVVIAVRWPHFVRWLQAHAERTRSTSDVQRIVQLAWDAARPEQWRELLAEDDIDADWSDDPELWAFLRERTSGHLDLKRAAECGLW